MFLNVFCHIRAASLQASRTVLFGSSSGSTRINQTLSVGLLSAFFEVIHHNIHRIFVLEVQGQHFHRLYTPLHSAATGFETAEHWASSMQKHGLFCHISIPEAEPPLYQHTLWHSSAREGTASSRRPSHILTVAEQKQAYKHGCSHQHFHLSGLQLCPSNKASLLSQSQEANQEWLFFLCSLCHQESKTATGGASFLFLRKKKKKDCLSNRGVCWSEVLLDSEKKI